MFRIIMKIINALYTRNSLNPNYLYVFTDNLNRTSGRNLIDVNSSYYKKYGSKLLYYPSVTTAQIRGCENAFPISTMKNQFRVQIMDSEFNIVSKILKDEIDTILINSKNYECVVFPYGQIGIGQYSNMKLYCPQTFNFLQAELKKLILNIAAI